MRTVRRASVVDVLLVALALAQQLELWLARPQERTVSIVVLTLMSTTVLLARTRAPLLAVLASLGAHAALIQLMPHGASTTFLALLATMAIAGSLTTRVAVTGLVAGIAVAFEGAWLDTYGGGVADFAMSAAVMTTLWSAGLLVSRHRRAAEEAARAAAAADRARVRAAEEAVALERARVTRELHDVVAHGLTIVVVQLVAAQEDLDHAAPVDSIRDRLEAGEQVARDSLAELRTLLGILKQDGPGDAVQPRGGLEGVTALVEQLRRAGIPVDLEVQGEVRPLPAGAGLALHRVVQESLTNVAKHAPGAEARLVVGFTDDGVVAEVTDTGPASRRHDLAATGSGHGLAGLRERVSMYDGHLDAAATADGGFRVRCELPLPSPDPTAAEVRA